MLMETITSQSNIFTLSESAMEHSRGKTSVTNLPIFKTNTQKRHTDLIRQAVCPDGAHDLLPYQGAFAEIRGALPQRISYLISEHFQKYVFCIKNTFD